MVMLNIEEFGVGDLAAVNTRGLTLVLPRSEYEQAALIGVALDTRHGVILDGELPFQAYPIENDEPWLGLLIPNVRIEVDQGSVYDPVARSEIGSIIREADRVAVLAGSGPHARSPRIMSVELMSGLPECAPGERAGFRRWRLMLGEGATSRELLAIDTAKVGKVRAEALQAGR